MNVIKVGGSLAAIDGALERVGRVIAKASRSAAWVVIPGGGPFADTVREFDQRHHLSPSSAHWMAILGMDQFAFALAGTIDHSRVVDDILGVQRAHAEGVVPVLAPSRWLRAADELPHRWEVTSDSLSAYLAMLLGAERLVLVKATSGGRELLDPYFEKAAPVGLTVQVMGYDEEIL